MSCAKKQAIKENMQEETTSVKTHVSYNYV